MTRFTIGLVTVLAVVVTALGLQAAFDAEKQSEPPHVTRRDGALAPLPLAAVGGDTAQDVFDFVEGIERAQWFAGVQEELDRQAADAAARAVSGRVGSGGSARAVGGPTNWDGVALCETGGDWGMQGSRYSGGLGFYNGSWIAFGGLEFAPNAGLASREEQIVVAERIKASNGGSLYGAWGCAAHG